MTARIVVPPPFEIPDVAFVERAPAIGSGAHVWLVRHAEVHADFQQRAYGNSDVPLSPEGEEQTAAMGAAFAGVAIERIVSSDLVRARKMAEAIAASTKAPLALDARLREVSRGAWQGLPTSEFRKRWEADASAFLADPWRWKGHGGESDADVCARAWPVVEELVRGARERSNPTFAITAHYNLIRTLVTRALGLSARASFAFRNDPAHATLLVDAPGGWRLVAAGLARPSVS